jgi:hypothetical protein
MSNISNKYKPPSATFRARYADHSNPEESWIKSEHIFTTPKKEEESEGMGTAFTGRKVKVGAKSA